MNLREGVGGFMERIGGGRGRHRNNISARILIYEIHYDTLRHIKKKPTSTSINASTLKEILDTQAGRDDTRK